MRKVIMLLLIVGFCFPVFAWAEEKAASTETPQVPDAKSLGQWWLKNPKTFEPMYPGFLYHIEGRYTLMKFAGNLEMTSHTGQGSLVLRKNIVTSLTNYSLGKTKTSVLGGATTKTETQAFQQSVMVNLTKRFSAVVGGMWKRDGAKYIDDRTNYYGGVYAAVLDTPMYNLGAGVFYGNEKTSYMNDKIKELNPYAFVPSYESDGMYFTENFAVNLKGGAIGFNQSFEYLMYFKDSEYYHWNLTFGVHTMISATTGVFTSYAINQDNNTFVETGKPLGYEKKDTMLMVGVMVNWP